MVRNKLKLYYLLDNKKILDIDNEDIFEQSNFVDLHSSEDVLTFFDNNGYEYDDNLIDKIKNIYDANETHHKIKFDINYSVSNRSIGELVDMFESGEIIRPDAVQRSFLWSTYRSSRLIESVLLGLPIPALFMMEVGKRKYELVDGLQRLTTFTRYIYGYSWKGAKNKNCRLSKMIDEEFSNKAFNDLNSDQQRTLKRSTIPVIEFKQNNTSDTNAKYFVFERINSGATPLTNMQIRKSLAYGTFMNSLYEMANNNEKLKSLFSTTNINKDAHVEALLRVFAITDIYKGRFKTTESNIVDILNVYCEDNNIRNKKIDNIVISNFNLAIDKLFNIFADKRNICRKLFKIKNRFEYSSKLQITILESMLGLLMENENINILGDVESKYKVIIGEIYSRINDFNPFSENTGTYESIMKRYKTIEDLLNV